MNFILFTLLSFCYCNLQTEPFITKQFIGNLEVKPFKTFAWEEHPFKNYTLIELKKLNSLKVAKSSNKLNSENPNNLPLYFNSTQKWPNCISPIRNQGHCGSGWAFAATEVLSDRFCIRNNTQLTLSPQYLISCDYLDFGCNGGTLITSWTQLKYFGLTTESCRPYTAGGGEVDSCSLFSTCADGTEYRKYYASSYYYLSTVEEMKRNIMLKGPIEAGFLVYDDFMSYKGGIYRRTSDNVLGGHAVRVLGWGEEDGIRYWIAANSWGTQWGDEGYFKIAYGECGFENAIIAGDPLIK
jgi:cathepsin B